jgi:hypothetical protein
MELTEALIYDLIELAVDAEPNSLRQRANPRVSAASNKARCRRPETTTQLIPKLGDKLALVIGDPSAEAERPHLGAENLAQDVVVQRHQ